MYGKKAKIKDYGFYIINQFLEKSGKRLSNWAPMPQVDNNWDAHIADQNPLIAEQRQYGLEVPAGLAAQCIANLNANQHSAFDKITTAIIDKTGETFFLHGPGVTAKTYLYNTLFHHFPSQTKI